MRYKYCPTCKKRVPLTDEGRCYSCGAKLRALLRRLTKFIR